MRNFKVGFLIIFVVLVSSIISYKVGLNSKVKYTTSLNSMKKLNLIELKKACEKDINTALLQFGAKIIYKYKTTGDDKATVDIFRKQFPLNKRDIIYMDIHHSYDYVEDIYFFENLDGTLKYIGVVQKFEKYCRSNIQGFETTDGKDIIFSIDYDAGGGTGILNNIKSLYWLGKDKIKETNTFVLSKQDYNPGLYNWECSNDFRFIAETPVGSKDAMQIDILPKITLYSENEERIYENFGWYTFRWDSLAKRFVEVEPNSKYGLWQLDPLSEAWFKENVLEGIEQQNPIWYKKILEEK